MKGNSQRGSTTSKIGRDAGTGQFTTVRRAQTNPLTHVVETIRHPEPPPKTRGKK